MQETWEDQKLMEVRTRKQKRAQRSIVVMLVIEEEEEEEEEGNDERMDGWRRKEDFLIENQRGERG